MKKILFALLFIAMAFSQSTPFDYKGWYNGAFYVPNTTYTGDIVVVDEGTLATETLADADFAFDTYWGSSGDFTYVLGDNFEFVWGSWRTSELEQLDSDFLVAAVGSRWYKFTYTIAVTTAFDGDAALTITNAFALTAVDLDLSAGTHTVYFKSAVAPTDFVISLVSGSDNVGTFTIDDVILKQIIGGDITAYGDLKVWGIGDKGTYFMWDNDANRYGRLIVNNASFRQYNLKSINETSMFVELQYDTTNLTTAASEGGSIAIYGNAILNSGITNASASGYAEGSGIKGAYTISGILDGNAINISGIKGEIMGAGTALQVANIAAVSAKYNSAINPILGDNSLFWGWAHRGVVDYGLKLEASDAGSITTGIKLDATTIGLDISGAVTGINIDVDLDYSEIGDDYPAGIYIDLQQTSNVGSGGWTEQGGMYGINSRIHVDGKSTGGYAILGRAYIGSDEVINDVVGVMGELRLTGDATRGNATSSLAALRGSVSNLSTGTWNGQTFGLMLDFGADMDFGDESALIFGYSHSNAYLDYGMHLRSLSTTQDMISGVYVEAATGANITNGLELGGVGTFTNDIKLSKGALFNNSSADLLTITEASIELDGNVGIGEDNPHSPLEVKGSGAFTPAYDSYTGLLISSENAAAGDGYFGSGIEFLAISADVKKRAAIVPVQKGDDNDDMGLAFFTTNGSGTSDVSERMRITDVGEVGMGTIAPVSALEIQAGASTTGAVFTLGTKETAVLEGHKLGQIDFYAPLEASPDDAHLIGASIWAEAEVAFSNVANTTSLVLATGVSETAAGKVWIKSDGKVGIGTDSPGTILEIVDNNSDASHTLFTMLNDYEQGTGEIGTTADIEFEVKGTVDSGINYTNEEMAKISAYKIGDFWTAGGQDDNDAGLKIYTVTDGAYVLNTTFSDEDITVVGNIAVGGTVDGIDIATDVAANTLASHAAVTLNVNATDGGLGLSTQEITFRAATNAQTGYMTAALVTDIEANVSLLNVTPGTATASKALVVDASKDITLDGGDFTAAEITATGAFTSLGIDDNATSNAITIEADEDVILVENLALVATKELLFDGGGGHTKIAETSSDVLSTSVGGVEVIRSTEVNGDIINTSFGNIELRGSAITMYHQADATLQYGMVAMVDAGTTMRFDVNDVDGDEPIGVVTGIGATSQGSYYGLAIIGMAHVVPAEDTAVLLGDICHSSSVTAGYGGFDVAMTPAEDDEQVGHTARAEDITATINSSGGVNTGTEVITLGVDVETLGWVVGDPVVYWNSGGATLGGLTDGWVYWLISVDINDVTISATKGGSLVDLTDDGDEDSQYLQRLPLVHIQMN